MAPPHTLRMTSLTVVPNVFLIIFTSGSERGAVATYRGGVGGPLMEVRGAENGAGGGLVLPRRLAWRSWRAASTVRRVARIILNGFWASEYAAYPNSSVSVGTLSGTHGVSSGGFCSISGVRSR